MRVNIENGIPDRSRPGLTTTAFSAAQQGTGGNFATATDGQNRRKRRGGKRVQRQRKRRDGKKVDLKVGSLNVGTMTGKGREIVDVMERRKIDILCVQETRWKGSKARNLGGGYTLIYHGLDGQRNGVGVILKEEYRNSVLEVKRISDRIINLKVDVRGVIMNIVSAYAPQVGCERTMKDEFWRRESSDRSRPQRTCRRRKQK